ncbi:MAG: hypothetical protein WBZ40_03020, partial [Acidimicrobiia bacterium]
MPFSSTGKGRVPSQDGGAVTPSGRVVLVVGSMVVVVVGSAVMVVVGDVVVALVGDVVVTG